MPKRVAMTIAGAVSLGSYEAGVTYELLEAIRVHNLKAEGNRRADDKIYVDVITGASAGGMTAAMLAVWLMFKGSAMEDPMKNPLYHAWVERISLGRLVRLMHGDKKWHSLFSSGLIGAIGAEMLIQPMESDPTGSHLCLEAGAPLRIGIALTNLNGVNYMIPIVGSDDEGFNYTRSADRQLFVISPTEAGGPVVVAADGTQARSSWGALSDAAVGCGAFPFAFRPSGVPRSKTEFINKVTPEWPGSSRGTVEGTTYVDWGAEEPSNFAYTDGGVLQNQPLGIAKDLVDASVGSRLEATATLTDASEVHRARRSAHRDADDRLYVFISPNEVKSSSEKLRAETISLRCIGPEILKTYMRQATFHDWIMAERVNQSIRILDGRAKELAHALEDGRIRSVECLYVASDNLNDLLLGEKRERTLERLRHQYAELYDRLVSRGSQLAEAFVNGIATLEAAARLSDNDKMHIVAVLADGKKELAGAGISAFVGFFSKKFRDHDYLVGRQKARTYLQRNDVQTMLGLDMAAVKENWSAKPVGDPEALVKTPLSLFTMLRPGLPWLFVMLLLRIWVPVVVAVAYLLLARNLSWWPF